jgi:16S rRNA C967 or C1407 C5-methylase (RsmB/RsmF family)
VFRWNLNVAPNVKPGGKLIYTVCTLTRSETDAVVVDFNSRCLDFEPLELPKFRRVCRRREPPKPSGRRIWAGTECSSPSGGRRKFSRRYKYRFL